MNINSFNKLALKTFEGDDDKLTNLIKWWGTNFSDPKQKKYVVEMLRYICRNARYTPNFPNEFERKSCIIKTYWKNLDKSSYSKEQKYVQNIIRKKLSKIKINSLLKYINNFSKYLSNENFSDVKRSYNILVDFLKIDYSVNLFLNYPFVSGTVGSLIGALNAMRYVLCGIRFENAIFCDTSLYSNTLNLRFGINLEEFKNEDVVDQLLGKIMALRETDEDIIAKFNDLIECFKNITLDREKLNDKAKELYYSRVGKSSEWETFIKPFSEKLKKELLEYAKKNADGVTTNSSAVLELYEGVKVFDNSSHAYKIIDSCKILREKISLLKYICQNTVVTFENIEKANQLHNYWHKLDKTSCEAESEKVSAIYLNKLKKIKIASFEKHTSNILKYFSESSEIKIDLDTAWNIVKNTVTAGGSTPIGFSHDNTWVLLNVGYIMMRIHKFYFNLDTCFWDTTMYLNKYSAVLKKNPSGEFAQEQLYVNLIDLRWDDAKLINEVNGMIDCLGKIKFKEKELKEKAKEVFESGGKAKLYDFLEPYNSKIKNSVLAYVEKGDSDIVQVVDAACDLYKRENSFDNTEKFLNQFKDKKYQVYILRCICERSVATRNSAEKDEKLRAYWIKRDLKSCNLRIKEIETKNNKVLLSLNSSSLNTIRNNANLLIKQFCNSKELTKSQNCEKIFGNLNEIISCFKDPYIDQGMLKSNASTTTRIDAMSVSIFSKNVVQAENVLLCFTKKLAQFLQKLSFLGFNVQEHYDLLQYKLKLKQGAINSLLLNNHRTYESCFNGNAIPENSANPMKEMAEKINNVIGDLHSKELVLDVPENLDVINTFFNGRGMFKKLM